MAAVRLVEQEADALLMRSEGATLRRWLEALPAELAGCRPRLCLARARLAILSRRVEGVDSLLDAAERAWEDTPAVADEP
jgi:LuxR family maltose regulon positive regulatory protein